MQTSKVISLSIVGDKTGRVYTGEFTVKTVLSQRDEFKADLVRRQVLGPSPDGTPPAAKLQWDAYVIGQVQARSLESPQFWEDSDGGLDIADSNVITEVYDAMLKAEEELVKEIKEEADKAYEKLNKKKKD